MKTRGRKTLAFSLILRPYARADLFLRGTALRLSADWKPLRSLTEQLNQISRPLSICQRQEEEELWWNVVFFSLWKLSHLFIDSLVEKHQSLRLRITKV